MAAHQTPESSRHRERHGFSIYGINYVVFQLQSTPSSVQFEVPHHLRDRLVPLTVHESDTMNSQLPSKVSHHPLQQLLAPDMNVGLGHTLLEILRRVVQQNNAALGAIRRLVHHFYLQALQLVNGFLKHLA
jgi:hypothetical protein